MKYYGIILRTAAIVIIVIIITTKEERGSYLEMPNTTAQQSLNGDQPVSQQKLVLPASFPSLYTCRNVLWYGISLWGVWDSCPG